MLFLSTFIVRLTCHIIQHSSNYNYSFYELVTLFYKHIMHFTV